MAWKLLNQHYQAPVVPGDSDLTSSDIDESLRLPARNAGLLGVVLEMIERAAMGFLQWLPCHAGQPSARTVPASAPRLGALDVQVQSKKSGVSI